jgi:hypothetical protein
LHQEDLRGELAALDALGGAPPSATDLERCDAAIALAERAASDPLSALVGARAHYEKARVLSMIERKAESRVVVSTLVARYENASDADVRRVVCRALFGQTKDRLDEGADRRSAIVEYRHVLHIAERQPPIPDMAAAALYHLALTHGKIAIERENSEHREKAIDRFRQIEERFGTSREREIARWTARSALAHAMMLSLEMAGPIYDELFRRHAKDSSLELRTHAAEAFTRWAERCAEEGDAARAETLANRVCETFGDSDGGPIRERIARCRKLKRP